MGTTTFSIVIETENLAKGDLTNLEACLASMASQDLDVHLANDVVLIDSGHVPSGVLDSVRAKYPWIQVHVSTRPLHYYAAKMLGARLVTGEVVVFADSDMVYARGWLDAQLRPFERPDVSFTSGETYVDIRGPYTFSLATTWIFPVKYDRKAPPSLNANNAAARRSALLAIPFPTGLPLYRAQVVLHGASLRQQGKTIVQVAARGTHAPPASALGWALRFAVLGADSVLASCYVIDQSGAISYSPTFDRKLRGWLRSFARKAGASVLRTAQALSDRPARAVLLPLSLPISLAALLMFVAGGLTAVLGLQAVYRWMRAFEAAAGSVHETDATAAHP
jgi:glycosyltransferase involved in cell wall biosynthesis